MTEREFKVQVLETLPQWDSGLRRGLRLDENGLSLFANPAFDSWLAVEDWQAGTGDIVTDECGQTYWSAIEVSAECGRARRAWSLFRLNPATSQTERVLHFGDCGNIDPQKMWLRPDYLWILDRGNNRVLALSRENYQILYELSIADKLIDIDLDGRGVFYALVERREGKRICSYLPPPVVEGECFALKEWSEPVALAAGPNGLLYILDSRPGRFIRFNLASREEEVIGSPSEGLLKGFVPSAMQIDERGVIYLAEPANPEAGEPARLHLFGEDGSYLGETTRDSNGEIISWDGTPLPEQVTRIGGIGFDAKGGVYLATNAGLAKFSLAITPVGQNGVYYSKTLDNGIAEGLWHRIALRGRIADKTSVEVSYYASDETALRSAYEQVLSSNRSEEEKEEGIKNLLDPLWKGPHIFRGTAGRDELAPDMAILENRGRFLWLRLRLITFDERSRPVIGAARVYYPRLSYLRYLPPVYREDAVSAAFLERFLSIFETVFHGLDREIDGLFRYFDPGLAPPQFLRWLASWINLSIDEDLPEDRVRRLIRRAPELYGRKGTPAALTEFLEIYTGRPVSIREHARGMRPMVIGRPDLKLGQGTILLGSGVKGFRLGDTSVAGYSALRDRVRDPVEPFLPVARRFTIFVDMDRDEFNLRAATLGRILDEQKPAHTACAIRLVADQSAAGSAVLGISASVTGTQPYRVGVIPLGSGHAVAKGPQALRIERGAWIGSRLRL
ncbi:MAG TPA: phage tail protein [Blastocatellia bacterium]|nr:phage tail protein [Blastocatellia bacterium]